ncbi:MFS transporter [Rhizobium sp. 1AS11]|uniref:MFS transporter n=1 Tax=Rhizobium acaciae TaxID=2989736 RepID=UPI00222132A2|nr:MFS transporter [Rhizobium acaciae]MCW1411252.1 MFS transporter [Rhizobium acaciae]MCW1743336.1 MFS transporter [Rhizobium acaciae]
MTTPNQTIGIQRWTRVGLVVFISYLIAFAERSNIGVAAPLIAEDLALDIKIVGTLLSAFFWGYVLTQVPGGWIAQKLGPVRVVGVALIIAGIASCLTGMIHDLRALLFVRVILGIAEGVIWPSFAVLFIRWFPGNERGRAVSVAQYALPLSSVMMAPLAGWMIDHVGWPSMFVLQGIPGIVMGVVFMWLLSDDPATDTRVSPAEREYILQNRNKGTSDNAKFSDVLRSPYIWLLGIASFCWIMVIFSFGLWMPSLIKQHLQGTGNFTLAGSLTAIPFVFGALSMYLNARFSDRSSYSRGWFVAIPNTIAGIALLAQHYGPATLEWSLLMFSIAGAGLYSGAGTWWNWALTFFPRNNAGTAIGLMNVFASFGGIIGPMAVGYFASGSSPASSFYILAWSLFTGAVLIVILISLNRGRRDVIQPAIAVH